MKEDLNRGIVICDVFDGRGMINRVIEKKGRMRGEDVEEVKSVLDVLVLDIVGVKGEGEKNVGGEEG